MLHPSSSKKKTQQIPFKNPHMESASSLSKGSSNNTTPNKYGNLGSNKKQSNSLKKVKSVSQFANHQNSSANFKDVRSSSSTHNHNHLAKSPSNFTQLAPKNLLADTQ